MTPLYHRAVTHQGDEFRVAYMRPGLDGYPFGQIRGETGAWYNTEYAVLLERSKGGR
jgi:hypothetical protein